MPSTLAKEDLDCGSSSSTTINNFFSPSRSQAAIASKSSNSGKDPTPVLAYLPLAFLQSRVLSLKWLMILSALLRFGMILFGEWQDMHFPVKYTDVDYIVFSDAAAEVAAGRSPFKRYTYRYSPLLSYIVIPNGFFMPFGKILFSAAELLTGCLIHTILRERGVTLRMACACAMTWLFNPFTFTIGTRGNCEALVSAAMLAALLLLMHARVVPAAAIYGLLVHFRIYPIIYALPILILLNQDYPRSKTTPPGNVEDAKPRQVAASQLPESQQRVEEVRRVHSMPPQQQTDEVAAPPHQQVNTVLTPRRSLRIAALDGKVPVEEKSPQGQTTFPMLRPQELFLTGKAPLEVTATATAVPVKMQKDSATKVRRRFRQADARGRENVMEGKGEDVVEEVHENGNGEGAQERVTFDGEVGAPLWRELLDFWNWERVLFGAVSGGVFFALTGVFWWLYGEEFLEESLLYHVGRRDPRHNFSIYFYHVYLSMFEEGEPTVAARVLAFVPQMGVQLALAIKFGRDLPFCLFAQTLAFVTFNKVITAQYFVWYFYLLPLILPCSSLRFRWGGLSCALVWCSAQLHWLGWAYALEFKGLNVFFPLWVASLLFFGANVYVLHKVIAHHRFSPLFRDGKLLRLDSREKPQRHLL